MVNSVFEDFKEVIALGLKNNMPIEAKLILIGKLSYAYEISEITLDQLEHLRETLGIDWAIYETALKFATMGEFDMNKS